MLLGMNTANGGTLDVVEISRKSDSCLLKIPVFVKLKVTHSRPSPYADVVRHADDYSQAVGSRVSRALEI